MNLIKLAFDLARLKGRPIVDYHFAFWQSALLLTFIGLSAGLDHSMGVPMPWSFLAGLALWWSWFAVLLPLMRWWLKRGGRWNGEGPLFNLLVAACGIDILWGVLVYVGLPPMVLLPLWLYSFWVMGNALEHATGVGLGYAIGGQVLILMIYILLLSLLIGLTVAGLTLAGLMPMVKP